MIKVFCDMCGKNIDYSSDGVNVDFNHYGSVKMNGGEKEYQLCNGCADKIDLYIKNFNSGDKLYTYNRIVMAEVV